MTLVAGPEIADDTVVMRELKGSPLSTVEFDWNFTTLMGGVNGVVEPVIAHSDTTGQTPNDHHAQSHTVASHSDTTATGAKLDTLTDGSSTTLHSHDNLSTIGEKNPPIDADKAIYRDSTDSDALVTSTWTQIKAFLKTYFDTLYNLYVHPNHSGDVTSVFDGAQTIADDAVTYAKMQNVVDDERILGRVSGANGVVEELTKTEVLTMIGVENGAEVNNISDVNATDLTDGSSTTLHSHDNLSTIGEKNPPIDADKAIYRDSTDSDALVTSTWTQIKAFLKTYFDTLYNLYVHPNHSGDVTSVFDGAQTIADDAVTYAKMQNVVDDERILGRVSGANGVVEELTKTEVLTMIGVENGAEVNNISDVNATDLTDGGDTTLHDHDGISENTSARHAESHTIASHSDSTGLVVVQALGATTLATITARTNGMTVVVATSDSAIVSETGNIVLSGAPTFDMDTGDTLTLAYDGSKWRETGRSFAI